MVLVIQLSKNTETALDVATVKAEYQESSVVDTCARMKVSVKTVSDPSPNYITAEVDSNSLNDSDVDSPGYALDRAGYVLKIDRTYLPGTFPTTVIKFESGSTGPLASFRTYWMRPYIPDPNHPVNQKGTREFVCSFYIFNPYPRYTQGVDSNFWVGGNPNRFFTLPENMEALQRNDLDNNGYITIDNQRYYCGDYFADYSKGVIFGADYI